MIDIVIPTIEGREKLLKTLLDSIPLAHTPPWDYTTITVDHEHMSLADKRNFGAWKGYEKYILFIDDDNQLGKRSIEKLLQVFIDNPHVGIAGMVACYHDEKMMIADAGSKRNMLTGFTKGLFVNDHVLKLYNKPIYEVDEVANAFMIRRELFDYLDGFDSENFPTELDEADLCRRVKETNYRVVMCPSAVVYHKSQTYSRIPDFRRPKNAYYMGRNRIRFQRKHLNWIKFLIYYYFFMPVFICSYIASLLIKKNPRMIFHFLKGVHHGIINKKDNTYQS